MQCEYGDGYVAVTFHVPFDTEKELSKWIYTALTLVFMDGVDEGPYFLKAIERYIMENFGWQYP